VIAGAVDILVCLAAALAAQSAVLLADFLKTTLEFVAVLLAWFAMRRLARGGAGTCEYGGINAWRWRRCRRAAQDEDSPLMAAQARLLFTKLFGNVFILASLSSSLALADRAWSVYIDPLARW
jgi:hypothetical protein